MKKLGLCLGLVFFVVGTSFAQSNNDAQRFVGTWISGSHSIVFNADGTGTMDGKNISFGISPAGVFYMKLDNNQSGNTMGVYFSPDGRRMILVDRDTPMVFQKK